MPHNSVNGNCFDSDEVFYLTVPGTWNILKSKENKENCHKDGLSKFYSKLNLYCKLLNFIDMEWSQKTHLNMKMYKPGISVQQSRNCSHGNMQLIW